MAYRNAKETFTVTLTSALQTVELKQRPKSFNYELKWASVTGASNFATDAVFYISGTSANSGAVSIGNRNISSHSGLTNAFAFPLTSANCAIAFPARSYAVQQEQGVFLGEQTENKFNFTVHSAASNSPTFTTLTFCLESID